MAGKAATVDPKGRRAESTREGESAAPDGAPRLRLRLPFRLPTWALALLGAALGAAFGAGIEGMAFGPPLVMLTLGGMTLALCGVALWRMIDPLTHADAAAVREGAGRAHARELEREKQLVLKAIKEIELDHQMRKIADADYRELIERYRTRAMRLISEIEAGDNFRELIERELKDRLLAENAASAASATAAAAVAAAPQTPPAAVPSAVAATEPEPPAGPRACPACATSNDGDAQFCKRCGVKLAA